MNLTYLWEMETVLRALQARQYDLHITELERARITELIRRMDTAIQEKILSGSL